MGKNSPFDNYRKIVYNFDRLDMWNTKERKKIQNLSTALAWKTILHVYMPTSTQLFRVDIKCNSMNTYAHNTHKDTHMHRKLLMVSPVNKCHMLRDVCWSQDMNP